MHLYWMRHSQKCITSTLTFPISKLNAWKHTTAFHKSSEANRNKTLDKTRRSKPKTLLMLWKSVGSWQQRKTVAASIIEPRVVYLAASIIQPRVVYLVASTIQPWLVYLAASIIQPRMVYLASNITQGSLKIVLHIQHNDSRRYKDSQQRVVQIAASSNTDSSLAASGIQIHCSKYSDRIRS